MNYKSLGEILWKVLKNPLCQELTYEEAAEYALEFLKLLGAPLIYLDKTKVLELTNYKAELPCDLLYVKGIRFDESCDTAQGSRPIAMRQATNIYHMNSDEFSNNNGNFLNHGNNEFTYNIQKGIIFTSMENGSLEISYEAIATDNEGYPLIPDHQKVFLGMEYYIMSRYLEPLYLTGKITDKAFEYIQQKRYFYMPSAFTSLTMPTLDRMESLMNGLNRLIVNTTAHQNFFKKAGEKERIKKYR
jgi:hypothetical protein